MGSYDIFEDEPRLILNQSDAEELLPFFQVGFQQVCRNHNVTRKTTAAALKWLDRITKLARGQDEHLETAKEHSETWDRYC